MYAAVYFICSIVGILIFSFFCAYVFKYVLHYEEIIQHLRDQKHNQDELIKQTERIIKLLSEKDKNVNN